MMKANVREVIMKSVIRNRNEENRESESKW